MERNDSPGGSRGKDDIVTAGGHSTSALPHAPDALRVKCGATVAITNTAFLRAIFSKTPDGASAWACGFVEDPHLADPRRWHGRAVVGGLPGCIQPHHNNFFAISSFRPGPDGIVRRRKENFAACHVVMVDGRRAPDQR